MDPAGFGPAINRFLGTRQGAYEPGALTGLSYGSTKLFSYYSCFIADLNIFRLFKKEPHGSTLCPFVMVEVFLSVTSAFSKVASAESVELFVFVVA